MSPRQSPLILLTSISLMGLPAGHAWVMPSSVRTCSSVLKADVQEKSDNLPPMLDDSDQEKFLSQCKSLCEERNLPFAAVKNARDLSSVRNSPVQPGRVFRMGRVSDATEADLDILLDQVNFQTLVDLRSPTELKDDPTLMREAVFQDFTNVVWQERGRRKPGCLRELKEGEGPIKSRNIFKRLTRGRNRDKEPRVVADAVLNEDEETIAKVLDEDDDDDDDDVISACEDEDDEDADCGYDLECGETEDALVYNAAPDRKERHFVSLMNEFKYVKGTLSKVRKRDITKSILKSPGAILSRRVRSSAKKPFLDEINGGGLRMLNELLLRYGAPGIRYVLELCADRNRHPIAFYCTAGKDRTGMIAALILALCGVEPEDIVEDYTLSANVYAEMNDHQAMVGALSQRSLDPKTFLGAPPTVMRDILLAIKAEYGSVEEYCSWIGFGPEKQQQLREALLGD